MGGAFGGKEVQANPYAAIAALGAWKTRRPVRVRLTRELDMAITGKRHPYLARYAAGFSSDGRLNGLRVELFSDGGWSLDLSEPIMWRSMFHIDNTYKLPAVEVRGRVCRTHKTSQTAFRGFGGPQGMIVIEEILSRAAHALNLPADVIRERNFYQDGDETHYGEQVRDAARIELIWNALKQSSGYAERRDAIARFNAGSVHYKRGLAITPVKFGISFTASFYNQAGAVVLVYRDGTVQVNHGGTEMGQGLFTKILQIAADSLGVPASRVRVMSTRTDKVPNTSATAASSGADLNGAAVQDACLQITARLAAVAATVLDCEPADVQFDDALASARGRSIEFSALCETAYRQRVPLFADGFYRTPDIHFDFKTSRGRPFHYYAYGAAVSEVEVDGFTGQFRLLRTDILHDAGDAISPIVDRGQIEGGFLQGVGWLTLDQHRALAVRLLGCDVQIGTEQAIGKHQPGHHAQSGRSRRLEQFGRRLREVRAEYERRRRAVRGERAHEERGRLGCICAIGHPRLFRQRDRLEPVDQRSPHRTDDARLRKMHVRVDKPRQNEPAAPVEGLGA